MEEKFDRKFKRKNDIGVDIEYYVIGIFKDNDAVYSIYTDFVTDNSSRLGLRLLVDRVVDNKFEILPKDEASIIIDKFDSEILNKLGEK